MFFHWSIAEILLLYWFESAIVGFFNVLKMLLVNKFYGYGLKIFFIPFFILHFGGFMLGHLAFIFILTASSLNQDFIYVKDLFSIFHGLIFGIVSLFLSHGYSFILNYIVKGEYKRAILGELMVQPYARIMIMHVSIIFGAFLTMVLGNPIGLLLILIVLKTTIDAFAHIKERTKFQAEFKSSNLDLIQGYKISTIFSQFRGFKIAFFIDGLIALCIIGFGIYTIFFRYPDLIPSILNTKIAIKPVAEEDLNTTILFTPTPSYLITEHTFNNWQNYSDSYNNLSISYPAQFKLTEEPYYSTDGKTLLAKDILINLTGNPLTSIKITRSKSSCEFVQSLYADIPFTKTTKLINSQLVDWLESIPSEYYSNQQAIFVYAQTNTYCYEVNAQTPTDSGITPILKEIIETIKL